MAPFVRLFPILSICLAAVYLSIHSFSTIASEPFSNRDVSGGHSIVLSQVFGDFVQQIGRTLKSTAGKIEQNVDGKKVKGGKDSKSNDAERERLRDSILRKPAEKPADLRVPRDVVNPGPLDCLPTCIEPVPAPPFLDNIGDPTKVRIPNTPVRVGVDPKLKWPPQGVEFTFEIGPPAPPAPNNLPPPLKPAGPNPYEIADQLHRTR